MIILKRTALVAVLSKIHNCKMGNGMNKTTGKDEGAGMEKKAMMIRNGASFMVNAIQKNLEEAGYSILPTDATVAAVSAQRRAAEIIIFYLGDFVSDASELLVYLKDLCTEEEKLLILLGNPAELAMAEETIPTALVAASFERPLDIKKLIDELDHLVQVNDENARKKTILLVDDDNTFLKTVKGWLASKYRVTIVTSGAPYTAGYTSPGILRLMSSDSERMSSL